MSNTLSDMVVSEVISVLNPCSKVAVVVSAATRQDVTAVSSWYWSAMNNGLSSAPNALTAHAAIPGSESAVRIN
ncbi:hypothetical protein ACTXG5_03220 [Mycobacterium sp. Dal123C01]|uniref:hypothetical protein n=1 Tax=Mycobacterium sp. Dal123C01 TaxID=3457577 RepID=UPI00403E554B